jgi:hypothetical protein
MENTDGKLGIERKELQIKKLKCERDLIINKIKILEEHLEEEKQFLK